MSAPVIKLESVDSTQAIAFALAAEGAPDGTAVIAAHQREGRGRRGRTWSAPPDTALLTSIVVRPAVPAKDVPLYSLVAALATADTVAQLGAVAPRLKWPNDVLVGGRKIAGILLESRTIGSETVVAIGIGVNLRQGEFPADLEGRATSIRLETGREVTPDEALAALRSALGAWRERFERDGVAPVRQRWLALADTIGRRVQVAGVEGIAVDLADDGALVIDDGVTRRRVMAGDVEDARVEDHVARR